MPDYSDVLDGAFGALASPVRRRVLVDLAHGPAARPGVARLDRPGTVRALVGTCPGPLPGPWIVHRDARLGEYDGMARFVT